MTDAVTSTVTVEGEFVPNELLIDKPSIRVRCAFFEPSQWSQQKGATESSGYRTTILVDLPGARNWQFALTGFVRLDDHEPFEVDTAFLKHFEGITPNIKLGDLAKAKKVAIRISAKTAIFDTSGLRDVLVKTPNKCDWQRLKEPGIDQAMYLQRWRIQASTHVANKGQSAKLWDLFAASRVARLFVERKFLVRQ